jgi:hypothetical protein
MLASIRGFGGEEPVGLDSAERRHRWPLVTQPITFELNTMHRLQLQQFHHLYQQCNTHSPAEAILGLIRYGMIVMLLGRFDSFLKINDESRPTTINA